MYDTMEANKETNDVERIIVEINAELVGESDTPKKEYSNPWSTVAGLSLVAMIVSLFVNGIVFLASFVVFLVSFSFASEKYSDRAINPWKYKD